MKFLCLADVKSHVLLLLTKWGLSPAICEFSFDNSSKRFGSAGLKQKEGQLIYFLTLSKKICLSKLEFPKEIEQTILHEIAHLLDHKKHGKFNGHGKEWQDMCKLVGIPNEPPCCDEENPLLFAKYVLLDSKTCEVYKYYFRKPKTTNLYKLKKETGKNLILAKVAT